MKFEMRKLVPYSGLIVIMAALPAMRMGRIAFPALLIDELIIIWGYIASVSDLTVRKIPNGIVLAMLASWAFVMVIQILSGTESAAALIVHSASGFAAGGGLFLLVYVISRKGLGGGDVKFMAAAGLFLGLGGTVAAIFLGTMLAAIFGGVMILLKKINRKDAIPLAPFLYAGILVAVFIT